MGFICGIPQNRSDIEKILKYIEVTAKSSPDFNNQLPELKNDVDSLLTIVYHKELARRQRDSYDYMRNNLPEDYLFIDVDYKEKVK